MIVTSIKYRNERVKQTRYTTDIDGTIYLPAAEGQPAEAISFVTKDIMEKSLNIDNSAVDGYALKFGSVYMGKCVVTIKTTGENYEMTREKRERLKDAQLRLTYYQNFSDGTRQGIKLGTFYITDVKKAGDKYINITAYDAMKKFDQPVVGTLQGEPYFLINRACQNCGVSMKQTQEEIRAFSPKHPSSVEYAKFKIIDDTVPLYRNLLSNLAIAMGGFFTINRDGQLVFCRFGTSTTLTLTDRLWKSATFADYRQYYTRIKMNINGKDYETPSYTHYGYPRIIDAGKLNLQVYLDDFPDDHEDVITTLDIWLSNNLSTLGAAIPGEIDFILGDPSIELGDLIGIEGPDIATGSKLLITGQSWTYHGGHKLKSVGLEQDSMHGTDTVSSAATQTTVSEVTAAKIPKLYTATNASEIVFDGTYQQMASIAVPQTGQMIISGQATINSTLANSPISLSLFVNGTNKGFVGFYRLSSYTGSHTITWCYPLKLTSTMTTVGLAISASSNAGKISANNVKLIMTWYP